MQELISCISMRNIHEYLEMFSKKIIESIGGFRDNKSFKSPIKNAKFFIDYKLLETDF